VYRDVRCLSARLEASHLYDCYSALCLLLKRHPQLTHSLTPCSSAFTEKPPVAELFKNFPTFYETRRFITVFIKSPPLVPILSQINPLHKTPSYFSKVFLVVSFFWRSHQYSIHYFSPYSCYMTRPSHPP
jgi:hypothetical protein